MIAALIPVKRLTEAKSRLAGVLPEAERLALVLTLLGRTLEAVRGGGIEHVAVTTPDRALADRFRTAWVPDAGSLNASLQAGVYWSRSHGAIALLIIPADLPLISAGDIRAMLDRGKEHSSVIIAPCLDGGTGALLLRPPEVIPPCFGPDSYRRHLDLAMSGGIPVRTVQREGLSRDLDTEADLAALQESLLDARSS